MATRDDHDYLYNIDSTSKKIEIVYAYPATGEVNRLVSDMDTLLGIMQNDGFRLLLIRDHSTGFTVHPSIFDWTAILSAGLQKQ